MRIFIIRTSLLTFGTQLQFASIFIITFFFSFIYSVIDTYFSQALEWEPESIKQYNFLNKTIRASWGLSLFFLTWNLIYFIYHYLQKSRKETLEKIALANELKVQQLETEKTNIELQRQKAELEMQALRAQMNPHFIFNSLNAINRFILQNNKAEASEYLTKFSRLVRMILQNSQVPLVSLESELKALGLYLEMEALRFDNYFTYKISVQKDIDVEVLKLPPLIIQPYVENAIWHGLMHKEEKGQLDIEVLQEKEWFYVKVNDNGIGRKRAFELASKSATKHKSMGLKITAHRIAITLDANNGESGVAINDLVNPDGTAAGTEVVLKMPVITA